MRYLTVFFTFFILSCYALWAVPACPYPVAFTQPNGETVTVMIKGDERIHWHETMDGYTLLFNKTGYLSYAQVDENGDLQPSDFMATDIEKRDVAVNSFLETIGKKLFYSNLQKQIMLQVWQIEDNVAGQNKLKGGERAVVYKTLCAFVQFPEKAMTKSMSDFEGLMNQLGYTGNGTGSVRDFFRESSYGQFDLEITLCGIYTAPQSEEYYAGSDGSQNCQELAEWLAQQVAAEPYIDFTDYDSDNDDMVDGFHFIFAGRGQEAGGGAETIWSHKWGFSPPVMQNGKYLYIYSCSSELLYLNDYADITTIGVICHEMTHAFGAPDFYDTDYDVNGRYEGTGNWDVMAHGSWNGDPPGNCPPHHNMYTKIDFGWVTPIELPFPMAVTMLNAEENPVAYQINTTTFGEYYLLENRQQIKFDSYIPGNGLIIYHVHSEIEHYEINATHPQRMYPVCASAAYPMPTEDPETYGEINSDGCPFPGSSNNTSFTDDTVPAMRSWANAKTNNPINDITNINKVVTFNFVTVETVTITVSANPTEAGTVSGGGIYDVGQTVTVTATENIGYQFINWTEGGAEVSKNSSYSFTATVNRTLVANFEKTTLYEVIARMDDNKHGYTEGSGMYEANDTARVEAISECHRFKCWTIDSIEVSKSNPYKFIVTENVTLVANFYTLDFDTFCPVLWNNTFLLNMRKLRENGYHVIGCKWYRNGIEQLETNTINEFSYSAGPRITDLLERAPTAYSFRLITSNRGELCSTPKTINFNGASPAPNNKMWVYSNPVQAGVPFTVEGVAKNDEVRVYNQYGMCVHSAVADGESIILTLNVQAGVYVVRANEKWVKVVVVR